MTLYSAGSSNTRDDNSFQTATMTDLPELDSGGAVDFMKQYPLNSLVVKVRDTIPKYIATRCLQEHGTLADCKLANMSLHILREVGGSPLVPSKHSTVSGSGDRVQTCSCISPFACDSML